jgi:hypothetical protein
MLRQFRQDWPGPTFSLFPAHALRIGWAFAVFKSRLCLTFRSTRTLPLRGTVRPSAPLRQRRLTPIVRLRFPILCFWSFPFGSPRNASAIHSRLAWANLLALSHTRTPHRLGVCRLQITALPNLAFNSDAASARHRPFFRAATGSAG